MPKTSKGREVDSVTKAAREILAGEERPSTSQVVSTSLHLIGAISTKIYKFSPGREKPSIENSCIQRPCTMLDGYPIHQAHSIILGEGKVRYNYPQGQSPFRLTLWRFGKCWLISTANVDRRVGGSVSGDRTKWGCIWISHLLKHMVHAMWNYKFNYGWTIIYK